MTLTTPYVLTARWLDSSSALHVDNMYMIDMTMLLVIALRYAIEECSTKAWIGNRIRPAIFQAHTKAPTMVSPTIAMRRQPGGSINVTAAGINVGRIPSAYSMNRSAT